ncbi:VHS domain-containing protein [Prochlorococcus sp. MIT 1223]|uniref:VHS domain-containing protein n=1 Tax=Prochlorococcus sp. MIT 1223 TaxID=3096217 RepID=UPI002A74CF26|nr:VHS domain-containing protein [Prochlorococcus sp. MIT 1223]
MALIEVNNWSKEKDSWLKHTSLEKEVSKWAIDSIEKTEQLILEYENIPEENISAERKSDKRIKTIKSIRQSIKNNFSTKEKSLDNLSLNSPNSSKLQISVPQNLNYLMKAWAAAEGRDLSSVALQCLETGLRTMKSKGSIPTPAIQRYDKACEQRIALAEANNLWEKYEGSSLSWGN